MIKSTFQRIGLSWDWHFAKPRIGLLYYIEGSKLRESETEFGNSGNLELGL
jgi:hypothetical protein